MPTGTFAGSTIQQQNSCELPVGATRLYNSLNNVGSADEVTLQPVASCISPKFTTLVLGTSAGHIVSLNLGTGDDDDDADGVRRI